jgi:hypothetical protein
MKRISALYLFLAIPLLVSGQADSTGQKRDTTSGRVYLIQKVDRNGETLPEVEIKEVTIVPPARNVARKNKVEFKKFTRLMYNVRVVYPYALIVRGRLAQVNDELSKIENDKDRRKFIKDFEKKIFDQYSGEISDLTISQGRILIKLIDRETQNTSYELIKEYRGGLTAAFWQSIARIFGTNLKEQYDPYGEDAEIEAIVKDIEAGEFY